MAIGKVIGGYLLVGLRVCHLCTGRNNGVIDPVGRRNVGQVLSPRLVFVCVLHRTRLMETL